MEWYRGVGANGLAGVNVTIGFNVAFIEYARKQGVATYAMVNSIHSMALLLFFGVGATLQPIASFHYDANLPPRLKEGLQLAVKTALVLGPIAIVRRSSVLIFI